MELFVTTLITLLAFTFGYMLCEWIAVYFGKTPNWGAQWKTAIFWGMIVALVCLLLK